MKDLFNLLNKKQEEAVLTIAGPLLILAGPGSGKTRTLIHRIAHLIAEGISPYNILAVTFTNKAASEMRERVFKLLTTNYSLPTKAAQPLIGTFHSICAGILRKEAPYLGFTHNFTIYDDADQLSLIKNIMKDFNMDTKQLSPKKVASSINNAKDKLVSSTEYETQTENPFDQKIARIYSEYQKRLKRADSFDFGDLIMQTVFLFQDNKNTVQKYQSRFKYILVDEYQDTNTAQYVWLKLLASKHKNICVVGDDAQAIYSWRNANFQNILNFQRDWPDAKIIKLEQNYRSTKNIVNAASHLIKNNSLGYTKELFTKNLQGEPVFIYELSDEHEEAEFIVGQIENLVEKGKFDAPESQNSDFASGERQNYNFNNFVVLYRTNAQSRVLEQTFLRHDVPYKIVGGIKFYQRQEIKDLIAWLKLLQNKKDEASMARLQNLKLSFLKEGLKQNVHTKKHAIEIFLDDFKNKYNQNPNLTQLVRYIVKKSNLENFLRDGTEKGEERWGNIQELLSATQEYGQIKVEEALGTFLENVALAQSTDNINEQSELVHLMTLHMAKGLEFSVVFIAGCEEGLLPHSNSMMNVEDFEEERRLMYVGITRAKDRAYLLFAKRRMLWGSWQSNSPSSFLSEIPNEYTKFVPLNEYLIDDEEIIEV